MRVTPSFLFAADDDRCLRRMDEPTVGMVRSNRGFDFTTAPFVDTPRRYRAGNVAAGTTLRLRKGGSVYSFHNAKFPQPTNSCALPDCTAVRVK
jgi:hypothetical protein